MIGDILVDIVYTDQTNNTTINNHVALLVSRRLRHNNNYNNIW